jgi:uncharacterized protein (TIGR03067 family)
MHAGVLMLAVTLAPADASAPPDGPPPPSAVMVSDAGELQGEWEIVSCVVGKSDESELFKGDRWRFAGTSAVRIDATQGQEYRADLRVNPAADTPAIDLTTSRGEVCFGIYRRTGDELIWVMDRGSGRRLSSFEPAPSVEVWTLRRVKK